MICDYHKIAHPPGTTCTGMGQESKQYMWPNDVTEDTASRSLDRAGKLKVQSARPELKKTDYEDKSREPEFGKVRRPAGAPG